MVVARMESAQAQGAFVSGNALEMSMAF